MKSFFRLLILIAFLFCFVWVCHANQDEELPAELSLQSAAHAAGVRGGDLAEALGLPRQTNKETPLAQMRISAIQLTAALQKLGGHPEQVPGLISSKNESNPLMSVNQIAGKYGFTPKALAHDLKLSVDKDLNVPVASYGVTQDMIDNAIAHNLSHEGEELSNLKYPVSVLICLFAVIFLLKWGVPKKYNPKVRKGFYPQWVFIVVLIFVVIVLGFLLGKSPNPMEGAVKVFKSMVGLYESIWTKIVLLMFFLLLAVVANKAICGWACPFGAVQELIYFLPVFKKLKKKKLPFWISNTVRIALFIVFLLLLFGVLGSKKGYVIYHNMNPFNMFNFDISSMTMGIFIIVYLVVSFFLYRPFCRFICPFGLISWVFERFSLSRVRIDFDRCTDCGTCDKRCPLTAAKDRVKQKTFYADCFSCMRCLRACPANAIHYRPVWGPASPPGSESVPKKATSNGFTGESESEKRKNRSGAE